MQKLQMGTPGRIPRVGTLSGFGTGPLPPGAKRRGHGRDRDR